MIVTKWLREDLKHLPTSFVVVSAVHFVALAWFYNGMQGVLALCHAKVSSHL
jgi:hypothetical protein